MASTLEIFSSVVTACRNPVSNNSLTISCLLRESPPTLQKFLPDATAPLPSQSPLCVLARSSLIALSMASSMFALHWWLGISRVSSRISLVVGAVAMAPFCFIHLTISVRS
eukprot:Tamp_21660.p3 GENE.Tamp_21660~~Tamp_21660.p3  ORF type:complete len:111 (-),score=7.90 Tamp_21660:543-875(-)